MCQVGTIGKLLHLYVHQPVRTNASPPILLKSFRLLPKLKVNNSFNYVHRIWSIRYRKDSSLCGWYDSYYMTHDTRFYTVLHMSDPCWQVVIWPVASLIVNPNLTNSLWFLSLKKVLKHSAAIIINQLHHIHSKTILPPLTKHLDAWFGTHPVYY